MIVYDLGPQTSTPFPWATLTVSVKSGTYRVIVPLAKADVVIVEIVALLIVVVKQGSTIVISKVVEANRAGKSTTVPVTVTV